MSRIAGLPTIAVKDGFRLVPNADVLMIGDHRYARRTPDLTGYKGPLILYTDPDEPPGELFDERMQFIPKVAGRGFSTNPKELRGTFTTTALALNYAMLAGAKEVILIGIDGKPGPNNERHFTGEHKEHWEGRYEKQQWGYQRQLDAIKAAGMTVWNANRKSAVRWYPFLPEGII